MPSCEACRNPDRKPSFDRLLDFTDLKRFQDRLAGKLSGGMKQKLGLACALLKQPKLLLLDEPGVGVDPDVAARTVGRWSSDLTGEGDRRALVHRLSRRGRDAATSSICCNEGKLLHAGPPGELAKRSGGAGAFACTVAPRAAPIAAAQGARPRDRSSMA